ncbi:MAG: hypothetical protein ACXVBW_05655 [Bdellovibrionota bacterium]
MRKPPYRRRPKLLPIAILAVITLVPVAVVQFARPNGALAGNYSGDKAFGRLELRLDPTGNATLRSRETSSEGTLTQERDFIHWAALGSLVILRSAGQTDFLWFEAHRTEKGAALHRLFGVGKSRVGESILWRD